MGLLYILHRKRAKRMYELYEELCKNMGVDGLANPDRPEWGYVHKIYLNFDKDPRKMRLRIEVLPDTPDDMIRLLPEDISGEPIEYRQTEEARLA